MKPPLYKESIWFYGKGHSRNLSQPVFLHSYKIAISEDLQIIKKATSFQDVFVLFLHHTLPFHFCFFFSFSYFTLLLLSVPDICFSFQLHFFITYPKNLTNDSKVFLKNALCLNLNGFKPLQVRN